MAGYIKFDEVRGEATAGGDETHKKWIDIVSMGPWGAVPSVEPEAGGADDLAIGGGEPEPVLIGLLLPAVQKVREAAGGPSDGPGAVQAEEDAEAAVGLLLPAVQKVREAAGEASDGPGAVQAEEEAEAAVGLLLPAVQKVREAAGEPGEARSGGDGADTFVLAPGGGTGPVEEEDEDEGEDIDFSGGDGVDTFVLAPGEGTDTIEDEGPVPPYVMVDEEPVVGLLLPAVQKVREAQDAGTSPGAGAGPLVFDGADEVRMFGDDRTEAPPADSAVEDTCPSDDASIHWRGGDVVGEDGFV